MTKEYLSRDAILGFSDLEITEVEVPEWGGGVVRVRSLTGKEWASVEDAIHGVNGKSLTRQGFRERLVFLAAVDTDGNQLFTEEADVQKLGGKNWIPLERIAGAVVDISGATPGKVAELVGKSGTTPGSGSSTG